MKRPRIRAGIVTVAATLVPLASAGVVVSSSAPVQATTSLWATRASLPVPLGAAAGAAGQDGRIYVTGGQVRIDDFGDTCEVADTRAYDPATNTWKNLKPMPTPRSIHASATGPDGTIYALGGQSLCTTQPDGNFAYSTVEAYNPRKDKWKKAAPMPAARYEFHATTANNGRIYVTGGFIVVPTAGGGFTSLPGAATWMYNPIKDSWATVAPMPDALSESSAALGSDGRIYEMGGVSTSTGLTTKVEVYDPTTDTWTAGVPMPELRRYSGAALGSDGLIYVVGGQGPNFTQPSATLVYDARTGVWSSVEADPSPRLYAAVAAGTTGVYEICGGGPNGLTDINEVLSTQG